MRIYFCLLLLVLGHCQASFFYTESKGESLSYMSKIGETPKKIVEGLVSPKDLTIDESNNKIFWVEGDGEIKQAALDGSSAERVLGPRMDGVEISAHADSKKIYYIRAVAQTLHTVGYDGKNNVEIADTKKYGKPTDIAVSKDGSVFVLVQGLQSEDFVVLRFAADGGVGDVVAKDIVHGAGLAVNDEAQLIYFVQGGHNGVIFQCAFDGSSVKPLVEGVEYGGKIVVGVGAKNLLFVEAGTQIAAVQIDGTEKRTVLEGLADVSGLVTSHPVSDGQNTVDTAMSLITWYCLNFGTGICEDYLF